MYLFMQTVSCFLVNASYFGLASLRTPISINKKHQVRALLNETRGTPASPERKEWMPGSGAAGSKGVVPAHPLPILQEYRIAESSPTSWRLYLIREYDGTIMALLLFNSQYNAVYHYTITVIPPEILNDALFTGYIPWKRVV